MIVNHAGPWYRLERGQNCVAPSMNGLFEYTNEMFALTNHSQLDKETSNRLGADLAFVDALVSHLGVADPQQPLRAVLVIHGLEPVVSCVSVTACKQVLSWLDIFFSSN